MKLVLVSFKWNGKLHWRLIMARLQGNSWRISPESYGQFLHDIGYDPANGNISLG